MVGRDVENHLEAEAHVVEEVAVEVPHARVVEYDSEDVVMAGLDREGVGVDGVGEVEVGDEGDVLGVGERAAAEDPELVAVEVHGVVHDVGAHSVLDDDDVDDLAVVDVDHLGLVVALVDEAVLGLGQVERHAGVDPGKVVDACAQKKTQKNTRAKKPTREARRKSSFPNKKKRKKAPPPGKNII